MKTRNQPLQVLFVCSGNAGRSQLAQAIASSHGHDLAVYESAGVKPWVAMHPMTVELLREIGVNDTTHYPKDLAALAVQNFDVVVTIGDPARELLPHRMPGNPYRIHWDIADPADADGTPDTETVFRAALTQIKQRMSGLRAQLARLLQATDYDGCLMWEIGVGRDEFNPQILTDTMIGHWRLMEHLQALSEGVQASPTKTT